ncbi:Chromosomal replication initiator DnaA [Desulfovibrio sp. X2]|uniref:DnaA ATPase domain-containing protein n=1 Tax=Desulfovibrio sp. X2 TaxID=941449 RepID=UPI000358F243|nr:DnaA/Hda family protein [Desulfovibrio sp. X2]EPR44047.1 Chromosomal replication initiator DnaA [Desulfovibrio sp. X2]
MELRRWFDPLSLEVQEREKRLQVTFPHSFFSTWFAQNVQGRFEEQLSSFLGPGFVIAYSTGRGATAPKESLPAQSGGTKSIDFPFGGQFSFESFLVNQKNYFPLASAREVAKQQSIIFNPFIVCGENGSGKTHLIRAIANEVSKKPESTSIFLGTVEDIGNIYATRFGGDVFKAREHFTSYDVLCIDDFQLIQKNLALQQELVVLFNAFYDNRKQMVFACSDKLTSYDFLHPTLKSRLEWGLIVNLKAPDLEIRVQYIRQQCRQKKISLDKEQILMLGQRFQDFRFLQGILLKIFAYKELVNKDIGPKDFDLILAHTEDAPKPALTSDMIIETVGEHFSISPKEIKGAKRHHEIVKARQMAMFLCRELLGSSFPALGRIFGGKDHSTALYAVNKVKKMQKVNKDTKQLLITLKQKCVTRDRT